MKIKFLSLAADDIFISYSRQDANTYAVGLADELTKKGFSCFFDRLGTEANRNLPPSLIKKIKSCSMLVLVGTSAAGKSKFVSKEIDEFATANGSSRIVPVDFGGTLQSSDWYSQIAGIAPETEDGKSLETGNPSPTVVSRIEKSFKYARSKDRLRRYTIGAGSMLVILVAASIVAGVVARGQLAQARAARLEAEGAKVEAAKAKATAAEQERLANIAAKNAQAAIKKAADETARAQQAESDAKEAKDQALLAKNEADKQRQLADLESKKAAREAQNARASGLVSVARGMVNADPSTASLLLLEANSPKEPSGGVAAARELLDRYTTKTVLRGHVKSPQDVLGINTVAFSPDGTSVVTTGSDRTVRVWSTDPRGRSIVLARDQGEVRNALFSSDSKKIAIATDKGAQVWNIDGSGTPVVLGNPERSQSLRVGCSPDGNRLFSIDRDNAVRLWKPDGSGTPIVLRHPDYVGCAVFSPDGKLIVTGSGDSITRVWNADGSGQPIVLKAEEGAIVAADFSPDGKLIVTGSLVRGARVWHADGKGESVLLGKSWAQVQGVKFSPDGKTIAMTILRDGPTLELRPADGTGQPVLFGAPTFFDRLIASGVQFTKDGKHILVSWSNGKAEIWKVDGTGAPVVLQVHDEQLFAAAFNPDEREIVTASREGVARIWTKSTRDDPLLLKGDINSVAHFSSDGRRIVSGRRLTDKADAELKNTALVWNVDGTDEPIVLRGHEKDVYSAEFNADGSKVITASFDGTARVWKSDGSGNPIVLSGHGGPVFIAKFSPDDSHILTVTSRVQRGQYFYPSDGVIRVWLASGAGQPLALSGHKGEINSAYFSPDSKQILSAGEDGTVRIWPADGRGTPIVLRNHKYVAVDARFDAAGKRIVSVSEDKTAVIQAADGSGKPIVWDAKQLLKSAEFSPDGTQVVIVAKNQNVAYIWKADGSTTPIALRGHSSTIHNASFSKDGKYVITSSRDGTARVSLADGTGEPLSLSFGDNTSVSWAELSPDSSHLLTVSSGYVISKVTARVWTVGWNELIKELRERTGECLTVEQRIKYLNETEEVAQSRTSQCEIAFGRRSGTQ